MRKPKPVKDYFGNLVEVGDRYFCGNPPQVGIVIKIKQTSIVLDVGWCRWDKANRTMNFKSPDKGVCLDKIPEDVFDR